jgi:hypothetical protein
MGKGIVWCVISEGGAQKNDRIRLLCWCFE